MPGWCCLSRVCHGAGPTKLAVWTGGEGALCTHRQPGVPREALVRRTCSASTHLQAWAARAQPLLEDSVPHPASTQGDRMQPTPWEWAHSSLKSLKLPEMQRNEVMPTGPVR